MPARKRKSTKRGVVPIVPFADVPELAVLMPGCQALLYYVDATGKRSEIGLKGVRQIGIVDAKPKRRKKRLKRS